jgi:hypothetical protein
MLIRPLVTLLLSVLIARLLARQDRTRASMSPIIFWGIVVVVAIVVRNNFHGIGVAQTMLLQRPLRGLEDFLFEELFLMLGYALALGALLAMPWLTPSSAREVGSDLGKSLREDLFSRNAWRKFVARRMPWSAAFAVILLLWRWIGARHYS